MSSFASLYNLLNTTEGMAILRDNSGQDDGIDTVAGVDWFTYNGVVASYIYVSGNSFVGFGSNAEHLKICRRDGKMWYLYRQEGIVASKKFLKIRWEGYTRYNLTTSNYALQWELFLFDDGGMYLNIISVPTDSSYLGTSSLICGSTTLTIPVTVSTPVAYSLLFANGIFTLSNEIYPGAIASYASFGLLEYQATFIQKVTSLLSSKITWEEEVPDGTTLSVYTKLSSGEYVKCVNGGEVPYLIRGANLSNEILYIKVEMSTTDQYSSPTLSNMHIQIRQDDDANVLVLKFSNSKDANIRNAVGEVAVQYTGAMLECVGGPILGFNKNFIPDGLIMKPNPHTPEHIQIIGASYSARLTAIAYNNAKSSGEHLKITNATLNTALIHIDDL